MVKREIVLGHIISGDGIKVDKAKKNLIVNLHIPTCVKEVGSFLGYVDFYHHFIKDFSKITNPFTNLLDKDVPFHFFKQCSMAFTKLEEALTFVPTLHPPI